MLRIPIFVPSRSRAFRLQTSVIPKIPKELDNKVMFVVPTDQYQSYVRAIANMDRKINVIDCPEDGISATRHWIGETALRLGCDKFIMMDDDLTDWGVRIADNDTHLRKGTEEDFHDMLGWVQDSLDEYVHCSISPRGNNLIRFTTGPLIGPKPLTLENVRTLRFLAYRTKEFLDVKHGRVPVMEDFDVNLQLLENGHKNIQSYHWSQDQRQTALPGGCSDYRSHEVHEEGARKLQELHPQFVKLRQKINKSKVTYNPEFRERLECTIAWKAAYASSQKANKCIL